MITDRKPFAERMDPGTTGVDWTSLRLLNSYRLFIALVLLIGFLAALDDVAFGYAFPLAFYVASGTYIVLALLFALTLFLRRPSFGIQSHLQLYSDILILATATFTSGGVASGLGVLMVVPVAGAGLLLPLRHALLFAALATLFVLGGEVGHALHNGAAGSHYAQAALLGGALFVSSGLAALFARRSARVSEIAERRRRDVRHLSTLNERIIRQMESGILVVDRPGMVVLANTSAWTLLGQPTPPEGHALAAIAPRLARALDDWQQQGRQPPAPLQATNDSGHERPALQIHFTDLGELGTLIALEDAAFLDEQLQQLKLASLGRLTAGIAHEVRNPLGAISHASQLLAESPHLGPEEQRFCAIILSHCRRVNGIVENVLQLSRRPEHAPDALDLGAWLEAYRAEMAAAGIAAPERTRIEAADGPLQARFDPGQLHQIVTNLINNAFEHGRRADGANVEVTIRSGRTASAAPFLEIEDNGTAIPAERIDSLFEPFVSGRHGGTGLGLFLARELCESNHARLRYRRGDHGNAFRITMAATATTT